VIFRSANVYAGVVLEFLSSLASVISVPDDGSVRFETRWKVYDVK
jgi:hypothetical protein